MKPDFRSLLCNGSRARPARAHGDRRSRRRGNWLREAVILLGWLAACLGALWACGALWFDSPAGDGRGLIAGTFAGSLIAGAILARGSARKFAVVAGATAVVFAWWLTLRPSNDRSWQPDVAHTAWAEIAGDRVVLRNVRNCEYWSETAYAPRWETREVRLSQITGIDVALTYWGSRWMAHPIVSFQFQDVPPVCFSIETRKELGEAYSAIGGLYRQYELIYICADERDVIRLRSNFRKGEDVYLYRTTASPAKARERFLEYVATMNALHAAPRWYNAVTTNCTTAIRSQRVEDRRAPWDWRMLVNGYSDELLAERGGLAGGLPFAELKARAHINEAARAANDDPEFSRRIRTGRPGFN